MINLDLRMLGRSVPLGSGFGTIRELNGTEYFTLSGRPITTVGRVWGTVSTREAEAHVFIRPEVPGSYTTRCIRNIGGLAGLSLKPFPTASWLPETSLTL